MTLYALKDPKGRIRPPITDERAAARYALASIGKFGRWYNLWLTGPETAAGVLAARRLGWRIVKVRVVEEEVES